MIRFLSLLMGLILAISPATAQVASSTQYGVVKYDPSSFTTVNGVLKFIGSAAASTATYAGKALIVVDANSLGYGIGSSHNANNENDFTGNNYPAVLLQTLTSQYSSATLVAKNFSVNGQTTTQMLTDVATQTDGLFAPATYDRQIYIPWEVTNDIALGGVSNQQAIDNYVAICKGRRAKGFLVVAMTVLPRSGTAFTVVNDYIRLHYLEFSDALADVENLPGVTYPDNIHPNDAGYAIIAAKVASKVSPLLVTGFNPQSIPFLLSGTTVTNAGSGTTTGGGSSTAASGNLLGSLTVQPIAAYSVRKLRSDYTGSALKVRRSSDNTESDIGFNTNGSLNTTTGTTFTGSNSAYASVFYDQKGTANFTQTTTGNQPRFINAGAVVTANTVPALEGLTASGTFMDAPISNANQTMTISMVATLRSPSDGYARLLSLGISGNDDYSAATRTNVGRNSGNAEVGSYRNGASIYGTITYNQAFTVTVVYDGSVMKVYINGTLVNSTSSPGAFGITVARLFSHTGSGNYWDGTCSELLVFNTALSSTDMTTIQTSQKSYFGTP